MILRTSGFRRGKNFWVWKGYKIVWAYPKELAELLKCHRAIIIRRCLFQIRMKTAFSLDLMGTTIDRMYTYLLNMKTIWGYQNNTTKRLAMLIQKKQKVNMHRLFEKLLTYSKFHSAIQNGILIANFGILVPTLAVSWLNNRNN